MATLVLDPATLQALRDLTDATQKAAAASRTQTQQVAQVQQAQMHGLHHTAHAGLGWQAQQSATLGSMHNLAMGQAMGQRLWLHPATGQMTWIPGGGAGGMGGGGGGPPRGPAGGGGMLGAMRGAGMPGPIAGPLAAAMTVGHLGDSAASLASVIHDPYMGGAAGERKLFRDIVPFGGRMQGWVDAISGRDAQMVEAQRNADLLSGRADIHRERLGFLGGTAPGLAGATAYARAYHTQPTAAPPVVDRGTAAGEQQYRDAMKLLPLKQESLRVERDMKKAVAERSQAEVHANSISRQRAAVEQQIVDARKGADRWSGVDSLKEKRHLLELDARQKELEGLRGAQSSAESNLYDKRRGQASAEAAYTIAKDREEKIGRAEVLQDQADRAKGTAVRLGSMNPLDRQMALQAVKIGREHGLDALPPEMRQMFAQLAPKEFEAAAAKAGQGAEFRELQAMGVVDAPGGAKRLFGATVGKARGPAELQKEADTLRKEAAETEHAAGAKAADIADKAGERFADVVGKLFDAALEKMASRLDDKLRLGR